VESVHGNLRAHVQASFHYRTQSLEGGDELAADERRERR
jgi:hypothetical protein